MRSGVLPIFKPFPEPIARKTGKFLKKKQEKEKTMKTKKLDISVRRHFAERKVFYKKHLNKISEDQNFRFTENKIYVKSYIPLRIPLKVKDWWGNYW